MSAGRFLLLLATVYAALIADTACASLLAIRGVSPDWCTLAVIVWLLRARSHRMVLIAAILGVLCDLATSVRVGPSTAAFAIAAYFIPRLVPKLPTRMVLVDAVVVGVATLSVGCVLSGAALITGTLDVSGRTWLIGVVGTAVYTGFVSVPILMIQSWLVGDLADWRWQQAV